MNAAIQILGTLLIACVITAVLMTTLIVFIAFVEALAVTLKKRTYSKEIKKAVEKARAQDVNLKEGD